MAAWRLYKIAHLYQASARNLPTYRRAPTKYETTLNLTTAKALGLTCRRAG
jgi:hypothetical protein